MLQAEIKTTEEEHEEEATANEICMQLRRFYQRWMVFLQKKGVHVNASGKDVFVLFPTDLSESSVKHCDTSQFAKGGDVRLAWSK